MTPVLVLRGAEAIDTGVRRQTDPAYSMEFYRRVKSELVAEEVILAIYDIIKTKPDPFTYFEGQVALMKGSQ